MNQPRIFNSCGEFVAGYHNGKPVTVHSHFELLRVCDFETLKEITRASLNYPIVDIMIAKTPKESELIFVVLTEDKNAHTITLKDNKFKILSSVNTNQNVMQAHTLLTDSHRKHYILFENGSCIKLLKKTAETFTVAWPNSHLAVKRLCTVEKFDGLEKAIPNSDAFIAFQKTEVGCFISSYFINFDSQTLIEGPFSLKITPQSQFLSERYFQQNGKLFQIYPFKELGKCEDIVCNSSVDEKGNMVYFTPNGIAWRATPNGIEELMRLPSSPIRVEACDQLIMYMEQDGTIVSPSSEQTYKLASPFRISEYKTILIKCGSTSVIPFPTIDPPEFPKENFKISEKRITSSTGAVWESDHPIIAHSSYIDNQIEYTIIATVASIVILKIHLTKKSIEIVKDETWDSPIIAVAISKVHYAVSTINGGVQVNSYTGPPYTFTFHPGNCLCLSLAETTLAAGFDDGTFILASLKERGPLMTERPFHVPVKALRHVGEQEVVVEWGEAAAIVSRGSTKWLRLPPFPGALVSAFASDLLALGGTAGLSIYNFPAKRLIGVIQKRVVGVCASSVSFSAVGSPGVRFFVLTARNELVVLYFHRGIEIDHQSTIDAEDALAVAAIDETAYVICRRYVAMYDVRGNRIDTVAFDTPPRYFEAAPRGLYVAFSRVVWYISRDQSMRKIAHEKSNITGFAAVDDERFVISTGSRILLCTASGTKAAFTTLAKVDRRVLALKAFTSKNQGENDSLVAIFDDDSVVFYDLPTN